MCLGLFCINSFHFPAIFDQQQCVYSGHHSFNTLLPTFKQKTGKADCLWACVCVRVCARQGHRFPVDARLSGISPAGVRVQRMCVTVASPLPTAGCDAPSHKLSHSFKTHIQPQSKPKKTHTFCPLKDEEPLPCRWRPLPKG